MLGNSSSSSSSPNCTTCSQSFASGVCKVLLMVFLTVVITLGNMVSLLVFLGVKQFRTSQGYLKVSLALADLAVGFVVVPYSVYREVNYLAHGIEKDTAGSEHLACFLTGPIFAGCTLVSISTIFLLSVERSIAVLRPLQKRAMITKRRTLCLILASWTMSFCLAWTPILSTPQITMLYNHCSKLCNYAFPADELPGPRWNIMLLFPVFDFTLLSVTIVINFVTFAAVHQYCKVRKRLGGEPQGGNRLAFSDINAAKTIGIMTFAFLTSFTPVAVFVVGTVIGYLWCHFAFYAFWFLASNSCWNVAIYSVWDPKFRQGVRELFNWVVLKSPSHQPERSLEGQSSGLACVEFVKEMFHPENTR